MNILPQPAYSENVRIQPQECEALGWLLKQEDGQIVGIVESEPGYFSVKVVFPDDARRRSFGSKLVAGIHPTIIRPVNMPDTPQKVSEAIAEAMQ